MKAGVNAVNVLLLPVSWMYGFVMIVRNWLYAVGAFRTHPVGVPVISVGNLTTGGSGKTPLVEYIVERLLEEHQVVAVVSRGYKRSTTGTHVVSDGRSVLSTADKSGDEPYQIAMKYPSARVVVDEERVRGAEYAVRNLGASVIVLDDGFQHRSIRRDLDVLVIDVERPPQRSAMLPAGRRREPLSALKRAQAIIYSRWSDSDGPRVDKEVSERTPVPRFRAVFRTGSAVRLDNGVRESAGLIRGKRCLGFCGIARPEAFRKTLVECGAMVKDLLVYPDHYAYRDKEADRIVKRGSELGVDLFVTTEKDAVRLSDGFTKRFHPGFPLYYLEVRADIVEKADFTAVLKGLIRS